MRKALLLKALIASSLMGEALNPDLISELKRRQFELDYRQAGEEASILRFDWVNQVTGSYSESHNDDTNPAQKTSTWSISASQPVFRSGGIYFGIKYANANERYVKTGVDIEQKTLIKTAVELMYRLRRTDLDIERQLLLVDNAKIDVERKKEQFQSGFLDSGTLDNAILDKNREQNTLLELKTTRHGLLKDLKNISDAEYAHIELPAFTLMQKETFLDRNLELVRAEHDIEQNYYNKHGITATYFPQLSLDYAYTDEEVENSRFAGVLTSEGRNRYNTYGFTLSMPLFDVNVFNVIESRQIDYLRANLKKSDLKRQEENLYEETLANLAIIDEKSALSRADRELYKSLLENAIELYTAGEQTIFDVQTLENAKKIKELELKLFAIDRQLQLLELYGRTRGI